MLRWILHSVSTTFHTEKGVSQKRCLSYERVQVLLLVNWCVSKSHLGTKTSAPCDPQHIYLT